MLLPVRHLIDRLGQPRARADALLLLRQRLDRLPGAAGVTPELLEHARRLGELRVRLTEALGDVRSCSSCAVGHPEPFGHWSGGHCCGGDTQNVFGDDELAALKLSGTTASRLKPARSDLAGCAFRGPAGCSLEARDRPTLCVRFICMELERELSSSERHQRIRALKRELSETFARFVELRGLASALEGIEA